jgi:hypothetical protein
MADRSSTVGSLAKLKRSQFQRNHTSSQRPGDLELEDPVPVVRAVQCTVVLLQCSAVQCSAVPPEGLLQLISCVTPSRGAAIVG